MRRIHDCGNTDAMRRGEDLLLELTEVSTHLKSSRGVVKAIDCISIHIRTGEVVALVGESGSGKSMTALTVMGLVPKPTGSIVGGSIRLQGRELRTLSEREMRAVRGNQVAMI